MNLKLAKIPEKATGHEQEKYIKYMQGLRKTMKMLCYIQNHPLNLITLEVRLISGGHLFNQLIP